MGDLRKDERVEVNEALSLSFIWEDNRTVELRGRCLDLSASGIRFTVPQPIPLQTLVSFEVKRLELHGSGWVRHYRRAAEGYVVGVHFSGSEIPNIEWPKLPAGINAKLSLYEQTEKAKDRRTAFREATDTRLGLAWIDRDGKRHSVVGVAKDSSSDGLSGVFPTPAPIGQLLSIDFPGLGVVGHGVVRHSTPVGGEYTIGMAFVGELQSE